MALLVVALLPCAGPARAQEWIPSSLVPQGREYSSLIHDSARGRLVLFGGQGISDTFDDVWEFDGHHWTAAAPTATRPRKRGHHAAAYDERRKVTVIYREGSRAVVGTWPVTSTTRGTSPALLG